MSTAAAIATFRTELAHGNDEEGNETDEGGDGAMDMLSDKIFQLMTQLPLHDMFIHDNCREGDGQRQERGEGEQRVIRQGGTQPPGTTSSRWS